MMNGCEFFTPQGWQCPICKRVYSPTTPFCYFCGSGSVNTVASGTHMVGVGFSPKEEKENGGD